MVKKLPETRLNKQVKLIASSLIFARKNSFFLWREQLYTKLHAPDKEKWKFSTK